MKLDIFMEFASPPGADGGPAERGLGTVVEDGLAVARAADRLGFDAVWLAEHHFLGDYCNAAAPELLLAAMARETRRIGLGFGIIPLPIHDPVRVAERLATLDLLSGGRVLWGVGRGVALTELEAFGIAPGDSRARFQGNFEALLAMLESGTLRRDGKTYALRPAPGPNLRHGWLAAVSPESFDLAARLGLGVLSGPFKPWPMVKADLKRYRRLVDGEAAPAAPGSAAGRTSFTLAVHCAADHKAARARAEPGLVWAYRKIFEIARPLLTRQIAGYEQYRKLGWIMPALDKVLSLGLLESLGLAAVGDPAHVAKRLIALKRSGLDRVNLALGGGDLGAAETIASLELLAREVRPLLDAEAARPAEVATA